MQIDMSDIINSPEFEEDIIRIVNLVTINEFGESSITSTQSTIKAVVFNDSSGLMVKPDYVRDSDNITIYTTLEVGPLRTGHYPDNVIYKGDTWKVVSFSDYSSFGFYKAIATMVNLVSTI